MKIHYAFIPAPGVYVSDLEYHEHGPHAGYITAHTTFHGKYVRDTVFRVYDPRNEHGMCLVRIEQSYFHPAARKHWAKIEQGFRDACCLFGLEPPKNEKTPLEPENRGGIGV